MGDCKRTNPDGTVTADDHFGASVLDQALRVARRAARAYANRRARVHRQLVRGQSWALSLWGERHYRVLSEAELRATRKSDTLFIFGSGYSINDISDAKWKHFEQHDTMGFNLFVHQERVRVDYHLIREIGNKYDDPTLWWPEVNEYVGLLHSNPCYADTIVIVQGGWTAIGGNQVVGRQLLPREARIFRFRNRRRRSFEPPSASFSEGLVHGPATLADCVNFAYILAWRQIVLVGVDLYDRRHFWFRGDETKVADMWRGASHQDRHNTADAVVPFLGRWGEYLSKKGVELYVYNPRSLLARVLPTYDQPTVLSR